MESPPRRARAQLPRSSVGRGGVPLLVLLAAIAFAAFAHGATAPSDEGPLQAGLAAAAAGLAASVLIGRGLVPRAAPLAWAGIAALTGFAVWSGISLAWSVAPDRTWIELNRALEYLLVLMLGVVAGSASPRAAARLAVGYLGIALAVALYALGGKVAPGLHVSGLFTLDHTANVARLQAPLDYWNALALTCALAAPIALRLAADPALLRRRRAAALSALALLIVCGAQTYSRGGALALVVGVVVSARLGGLGARSLGLLMLALLASVLPLLDAFANPHLVNNNVALGLREGDGAVFGVILALSLGTLYAVARIVISRESDRPPSPDRARGRRRLALAVASGLVVVAVGASAASSRGLGGTISHQWHQFTTVQGGQAGNPAQLISASSNNRWVWWKEAVGAWSAHPLDGWGAGSFPVTHLLYRHDQLEVLQPHSVPLQFLAETGIVGALLTLGGLGALLVAAAREVRRRPLGSAERGLAAALFAGAILWLVHGLYDWDWDIPGVSVPAFAALGVLIARPGSRPAGERSHAFAVTALAAVWLTLLVFAVSALVPAVAQTKAQNAVADLPLAPTSAQLHSAAAEADLAATLNPLSADGLRAEATIDERRGDQLKARSLLLQAVAREPYSEAAWIELARIELTRLDLRNSRIVAARALALDPRNGLARLLAAAIEYEAAPAGLSATATGTPLPGAQNRSPGATAPR